MSAPSPGRRYVTYGWGYAQRNNYSVVDAPTYLEAQQLITATCGSAYAFSYSAAAFAGQAERYGLTEIPLQPHTKEHTSC